MQSQNFNCKSVNLCLWVACLMQGMIFGFNSNIVTALLLQQDLIFHFNFNRAESLRNQNFGLKITIFNGSYQIQSSSCLSSHPVHQYLGLEIWVTWCFILQGFSLSLKVTFIISLFLLSLLFFHLWPQPPAREENPCRVRSV